MQANIHPDLQRKINNGIRFTALCSGALFSHAVDVLRVAQDKHCASHLHQFIRMHY